MPAQATKRCSSPFHSGPLELPLDAFHRAAKEKSGLKSRCKECIAKEYRENSRIREQQKVRSQRWYLDNREEFNQSVKERYRSDPDFQEAVKRRAAQWQRDFSEKVNERARNFRKNNPEKARARDAEKREKNRDRINEYRREWTARNREKVRGYTSRYQAANRDYYRAAKLLRQAREKANGGNLTAAKFRARWDYFNGKCWMCGDPARHMDHVKPVAKGGGSWASNLRPACIPCNQKKKAKWPFPYELPHPSPCSPLT